MKTFSQLLWLSEPELESVLQPDLHLSGNVATKRPRDLRKPDNKLHQCNIWADEKELPKLYGGEGAHNIPCQGSTHLLDQRWINFFQDVTYYNAYEKDIAIVNIFFGEPTAYGESIYDKVLDVV